MHICITTCKAKKSKEKLELNFIELLKYLIHFVDGLRALKPSTKN